MAQGDDDIEVVDVPDDGPVYSVEELEQLLGPEYSKDTIASIQADMEFTVSKNSASTYTQEILDTEFNRAAAMGVSEIDFSRKSIESIPKSLTLVVKLRKLILNDCKIKTLPSERLDSLSALRIVELRANSLTQFPVCFALPGVEHLLLDHNQIVKLEDDVFSNMTNLKVLSMFANKLKTFPASITSVSSLRKLDLACNFIKSVEFDQSSFSDGFDLSLDFAVKTPSSNGSTPGKRAGLPKRGMPTPKSPSKVAAALAAAAAAAASSTKAAPRSAGPKSPKKAATKLKSPAKKKRKSLTDADLGFRGDTQSDEEDYQAPRPKRAKASE